MLGVNIRDDLFSATDKKKIIQIIKDLSIKNENYCVLGVGDIAREILSVVVQNKLQSPQFFVGSNNISEKFVGFPIRSFENATKEPINNILLGIDRKLDNDFDEFSQGKNIYSLEDDLSVNDVLLQENIIPVSIREIIFKRIRHFEDLKESYCLYGTGNIGYEILSIAIQNKLLLPSFLVDHLKQENDKIYGLKIILPSTLTKLHINNIILGSNDQSEIRKKLPKNMKANVLDFRQLKSKKKENVSSHNEKFCLSEGFRIHMDGSITHCCLSKAKGNFVANIADNNLMSKIRSYNGSCQCGSRKLIPYKDDMTDCPTMMLVLQLRDLCQADCAFCPQEHDGKKSLENWAKLEQVFKETGCKKASVEGGEILIQPEAMKWIFYMKKKYKINFQILTNGCVNIEVAKNTSKLFSKVSLSMGGFSKQTYKIVLGMDFKRVLQFAQIINEAEGVELACKFLISPSSIHEFPLFIDWALSIKIPEIIISHVIIKDAEIDYENAYWKKIVDKVRKDNRKVFSRYPDAHKKTVLNIGGSLMNVPLIDENILVTYRNIFHQVT